VGLLIWSELRRFDWFDSLHAERDAALRFIVPSIPQFTFTSRTIIDERDHAESGKDSRFSRSV
jgi:hypothetical protein